ncbi:MAG: hypothetical protein JO233_04600 [Candidatus Eremiobacteraeota bacterium]|nr:hypothetical protein [Candidatus Eremiobacteraeota bacterium]
MAIFYRLRLLHYYDRVPFCSLTALRGRVAAHELTPERQTPAEKQHATAAP